MLPAPLWHLPAKRSTGQPEFSVRRIVQGAEDLTDDHDTQRFSMLLRDATLDSISKQDIIQNRGGTYDMVVEPMAVEDIHTGDIIHAWGENRGDRLVATVVLVRVNPQRIDPLNSGSGQ